MAARKRAVDHIGVTFGRLTIRSFDGSRVECECSCGGVVRVRFYSVRSGHTLSCGCLQRDRVSETSAIVHRTHGESRRTAEYSTWSGMLRRCLNPNERCYGRYGGAGISVCDSWRTSYETFLSDMGRRPSDAHSIDRIDPLGNYEPENCRWATATEQSRNRSDRQRLSIGEVAMLVSEWSEKSGIPVKIICQRLARGWNTERAVWEPRRAITPNPLRRTK
jgi:hypothetical protein